MITKDDILTLVETEMSEGCHTDYFEDYETELDFYLSNVDTDGYLDYLSDEYPNLCETELEDIRAEVIRIIKEKC